MNNREYKRVAAGAKGAFIMMENGRFVLEFTGYIVDISEGGMKIEVEDYDKDKVLESLNLDTIITFQAYDKCNIFGKNNVLKIFNGTLIVVRSVLDGEDHLSLGCKIRNPQGALKKYIEDLKVDSFLKEIGYE